ncbi:sigma-70 family RNA polymerase sigma factor [Paenibacillus thalictri]|uniref:Sigma-70 family RNA polymerase sigma factor n=1 Tax=Paenibacillus thalictri TaxID=2527873 RepID=A0A4V2J4Q5_9BACL|nr:sigma-70 family RNA polymerase sigma factor [Paenibacillus thalictri]TBL80662.1 sigma-70 family RNA polymerase sigma factor [Paenibacillus thalictri]
MESQQTTDFFREVFYIHYPTVRRKLFGLVRDEAIAEDLAQEVFLRLYRNPPDEPASMGAWLHRVLTRIAYDYLNKKARERMLQEKQTLNMLVTGGSEQPSNEQVLMRQLDQEEVREWLEELPERDRKALMLRYSGYSYAEIAEQLQVRPPLVGTLLHRATERLRRHAEAQTHAQR